MSDNNDLKSVLAVTLLGVALTVGFLMVMGVVLSNATDMAWADAFGLVVVGYGLLAVTRR